MIKSMQSKKLCMDFYVNYNLSIFTQNVHLNALELFILKE